MSERRFFRAAILTSMLLAAVSLRLAAQTPQRSMYVSVLDTAGAPVPGLGPSDFLVRDDNVAREVLKVTSADEPMQIEILVDNSEAARNEIADIRRALLPFVSALIKPNGPRQINEVGIVALADRPTILAASTIEEDALKKGVDRIFAQTNSGTLLLDGIIEVCRGFKTRSAARPVIVAITTEGTEFSSNSDTTVLDALRDSGAAFHAVVLGRPSNDMSDEARFRNNVLDRGPRETGGHYQTLLSSTSLDSTLMLLADELTHQYRVTFARPESLIPPEVTTVTATKPGMTARGTVIKEPGRK